MLEGVGKQGVSCSGHDTSSLKDASCVLVIQTLLRMLSFIAQRTVPCEKGGILELDQGSYSICQRCFAPPQPPIVPAKLPTTYALWPVFALPLRRVKCDATDALYGQL